MIQIDTLKIGSERLRRFQRVARVLSSYRNMPFAFYVNTSGGMNGGFLLKTNDTWSEIFDCINGQEWDIADLVDPSSFSCFFSLHELFNYLVEIDPGKKDNFYFFG